VAIKLRTPLNTKYYQLVYTKNGYIISFSNNEVSYYQKLDECLVRVTLDYLNKKENIFRYIPIYHDNNETLLSNSSNLSILDEYHAINQL